MNKKILSIIFALSTLFLIGSFVAVTPTWSAPDVKKQIGQGSSDKGLKDRDDTKNLKGDNKSVKKKVVKKAGTAAAVGVAGKKISSGVKGKPTKEKK